MFEQQPISRRNKAEKILTVNLVADNYSNVETGDATVYDKTDVYPYLYIVFNRIFGGFNIAMVIMGFYWVAIGQISAWYLLAGLCAYVFFGFMGMVIGLHRYFAHRSFKTNKFWHAVMALASTLVSVGTVVAWVGLHRYHHIYSDSEEDVHSPRQLGFFRAFFYLYNQKVISEKYARPELRDRLLVFLHRYYFFVIASYIGILYLLDPYLVIWLYQLPVVGVYLGISAITTVAHMHGYKSYNTKDDSKNSWLAAILAGGEGWHNNHHAYPSYHRSGHKKGEWDPAAWIIEKILATEYRKINF